MKRRLISMLLAIVMLASVVFVAPVLADIGEGGNIALQAVATAERENTPATNVNNGSLANSSPATSWNTWGGTQEYPTPITLTWDAPMEISSMRVMWWADNPELTTNGNVTFPKSALLYYYKDGDWVQITQMTNEDNEQADSVGVKYEGGGGGVNGANTYWNGVEFEPVVTTALRMLVDRNGTESNGIGISEWEVFGREYGEELQVARISGSGMLSPGSQAEYTASYAPSTLQGVQLQWSVPEQSNGLIEILGAANGETVTVAGLAEGSASLDLTVTYNDIVKTASIDILVAPVNIAPQAVASADRENTPASNVNNGALAAGASTSWNTWSNSFAYPTPIILTWSSPMEISSMQVMWWADNPTLNATDNVTFPKSAVLYYHDGNDWVEIKDMTNEDGESVSSVGVKFNGANGGINANNRYWNRVTFEPVVTDRLRMLVDRNGSSANGIGIGEWEVFGQPDNSRLWAASISGPATLGLAEETTYTAAYAPAELEGASVTYQWAVKAGSQDILSIIGADDGESVAVKGMAGGIGTLELTVTHDTGTRRATFEVLVESPESVDDYIMATAAGKAPILPDTVVVNGLRFDTPTPDAYGNNGFNFAETFESKLLPVIWEGVDPALYAADKAGTTFTVSGVVDFAGQGYPAKAVVTVNEPMVAPVANNAVTFENIQLTDEFWLPKQKVNAVNSLNAAIYRIGLATGGEPNFDNAIKRLNGESYSAQQGFVFQDTDIYKTLEAMAYTLSVINDDPEMTEQKANLEEVANRWIEKIEKVQYADGYVNTHFTLRSNNTSGGEGRGTHRWRYFANHEMYNAGHFFEAAVAYTRYREGIGEPDYRLYVVARRFADHIVDLFGPGGSRHEVPGHEEVELALVKIAKMVEEYEGEGAGQKYIDTAKLLIDRRGESRTLRESNYRGGQYSQDHTPFVNQDNVAGHSVRAAYLYSGASDIAALLPDTDPDKAAYINALDTINARVTQRNTYITGGVGVASTSEGFGPDYDLPNDGSYCEVCAGIAMAMWNQRMNLVHEDAKYADSMERALYNGILVGTNLEGNLFYYSTKLEVTNGNNRSTWFSCACCPPNLMRTIASISGYMYTVHGDNLFVNLYVGSEGSINVNGTNVGIAQQTNYPWEGSVGITLTPEQDKEFTMNIRIPGWVSEQADQNVTIAVNGAPVKAEVEKGYVAITRTWKAGDVISIDFPMEVRLTEAHPKVTTNTDRVAIERGPIVYAMERAGNHELNEDDNFDPNRFIIPRNTEFTAAYRSDLLKGVVEITADVYHGDTMETATGAKLQAIPYYAWNNRGNNGVEGQNSSSRMIIWTNAAGEVNTNSPMFTGREGEPLSALTSDQLNVSLAYRNVAHGDLSQADPLIPLDYTMFVAVYKPNGTLVHIGTDRKQMSTLNQVGSFQVSLDMPENIDSKYAKEDYYAKVFLWDSQTFIPIMDSYVLATPSM